MAKLANSVDVPSLVGWIVQQEHHAGDRFTVTALIEAHRGSMYDQIGIAVADSELLDCVVAVSPATRGA